MAASQPFGISCKGGLNTNLNQLEMLSQPGLATKLQNFEVDPDGGYRRINGYTAYGSARPNAANKILGLHVYADGLIICSGTNIYFSTTGNSWLQINKASVSNSGDNYSTFNGRSALTRTNQGQITFTSFEGNTDYGKVIITDGVNKPYFFHMTGTGGLETRTFFAEEITVNSTEGPTVGEYHKTVFVVGGSSANPNTIYYSALNDPTSFTGGHAVVIDDKIVGLKSFRDDIIIFCQNSLHKLSNVEDHNSVSITPIAQNVGCVSSHSIQEIGGDLVFLSQDGIRSVAGTVRIGDVELGSVSRQIQERISNIAATIDELTISSAVLRNKSQYRLFYSTANATTEGSKGIIGTLTANGFEWSETLGIQATGFTTGFNSSGVEKEYHGDNKGYIYNHDIGTSFLSQGTALNIDAQYITPNFDFGDVGTRKTIHYAKISISPEGEVNPSLRLRYDYESTDIPQPADYQLASIPLPAIFGSASFGGAVFGASNDPMIRQAVEGSGHSVSFRISSNDTKAPYSINGIYINYVPAGRR